MVYRDDARHLAREARWTVWRFLPLFLLVILILGTVGFATRSLGLWGGTIVERKVFEQSYQRSEALNERIATDEAALAQIETLLANPNLDADTRYSLQAQASAARARIATARRMQR